MDELFISYYALGVMALIPIYYGCVTGLKLEKGDKGKKEKEEETEFFSLEDAKMFPVFGSAALFSLYLLFTYFDKSYINIIMTTYFCFIGVGALFKTTISLFRHLTGIHLPGEYRIEMFKLEKEILSYHFGVYHLVLLLISIILSGLYGLSKHWLLTNLFAEAFALSGIQLLALDNFKTGIFLLGGLFFYDIFWVFGTNVMVTVAKNFDAPIKVTFPKNILTVIRNGEFILQKGTPLAMLGLGDIVIPGIFIALCLKFDYHMYLKTPAGKKNKITLDFPKPYFVACFAFYVLGLVTTMSVMHFFQAAQPALLYLSPACILSAVGTAFFRGELKELFAFETNPENKEVNQEAESPKRVTRGSIRSKKE